MSTVPAGVAVALLGALAAGAVPGNVPAPPRAPARAATASQASAPGAGQAAETPTADDVLRKAGAYAAGYESAFSLLVAEERYEQRTEQQDALLAGGNLSQRNPGGGMGAGGARQQRRVLRSEFALVRLDAGGWMPFRDVFEVDGRKVRNRDHRLASLFAAPTAESFDQGAAIMAESTRHNLGRVQRTINVPTLALLLVRPDLARRFRFERDGEEAVDGRVTWKFAFREMTTPSLVRTSRGQDLLLTGTIWIDPATGIVHRTSLTAADPQVRATVRVTFARDAGVDLWVPVTMDEHYSSPSDRDVIFCTATYSNYRKFDVAGRLVP